MDERRRQKPRRQKLMHGDSKENVSSNSIPDDHNATTRNNTSSRKSKRSAQKIKKSGNMSGADHKSPVSIILDYINDDVQDITNYLEENGKSEKINQQPENLHHKFVFVQDLRGFHSIEKCKINEQESSVFQRTDQSMKPHILIQSIYLLCNGLLGGISAASLIMIISHKEKEPVEFLNIFSSFFKLYSSIFNILCSVSVITALDRCNFQQAPIFLCDCLMLASYIFTLIMSWITYIWEEILVSVETGATSSSQDYNLYIWKTFNLCRCVGATLGWVITVLFLH